MKFNFILCIIVVIAIIYKEYHDIIKSEKKKILIHTVLLILLCIFHIYSLERIAWAVSHFDKIGQYFYKQVGISPPWLTLFTWSSGIIVGLLAILIAFNLARGKNNSRAMFIKLIPVFIINSFLHIFIGSMGNQIDSESIVLSLLSSIFFVGLFYPSFYFFYNSDAVIKTLFNRKK